MVYLRFQVTVSEIDPEVMDLAKGADVITIGSPSAVKYDGGPSARVHKTCLPAPPDPGLLWPPLVRCMTHDWFGCFLAGLG